MSSNESATQHVEYKNDSVEAVVLTHPDCRIEFRVKATLKLVARARKEVGKEVGKEITLPGFRKGKAPEAMVRKKYAQEIERRMPKKCADLAFAATAPMANIPLLNNNGQVTFDLKHLKEDGAELSFFFETEPKVPEIDPTLFVKQEITQAEVGEQQIEEAILQSRYFFATWKEVTERPIQDKDTLIADVDVLEEGVTKRILHQVRFDVSQDRMAHWMYQLVLGAKVGDQLEGLSQPDDNATEKEKQEFQPKKVLVTILKVEEVQLPAVDDAFAKSMHANDVAQMREKVAAMLHAQAAAGVREQLREQVSHFLLETYPFDLPRSVIKEEHDHRQHKLMAHPQFKTDWDKKTEAEKEAVEQTLWKESSNAVRLFYLSRHIVQQANIGISRQEVYKVAVDLLRQEQGPQTPVDQIPKEIYALAFAKVMLAKSQDFVLEKCAVYLS